MIPPGLVLADTSALARARVPEVGAELTRLGRLGLLATCVTIDLEVLYSARNLTEYKSIAALRAEAFTELPLTDAIGARARAVQAALAVRGHHRAAGVIDLLTAATAEHHAAQILHYDADFDHIAAVSGQAVRWIAPAGSID